MTTIAAVGQTPVSDGDLDPSFGMQGKVLTDLNGFDSASALAIQPDGKIVAAGSSDSAGRKFAIARFNGDGSLDPTFGNGGRVITDSGTQTSANALVIQPDHKIVVAGGNTGTLSNDFVIARYFADGSIDSTFGNGGLVTTDFGRYEWATSIALQPDGKIVVAGGQRQTTGYTSSDVVLSRYNTDGSLDPSFGSAGKVITDFGDSEQASAIAIQDDGRILVAGGLHSIFNARPVLARYNTDGSLDTAFGIGGKAEEFGDTRFYAISIQSDGRILVAGGAGLPRVTIDDLSQNEGNLRRSQFVFTVSLSKASNGPVSVRFATADGSAKSGEDYQAQSGLLILNPGETIKTVAVDVIRDRQREDDEVFYLNLSAAEGAFIADSQGIGVIRNDDR